MKYVRLLFRSDAGISQQKDSSMAARSKRSSVQIRQSS
jgi:hypothetical protein